MKLPAKKLRIAVLNRVFSPTGGGAERYSIALVEQLASRHDIHVFAQQIEHAWPGVTYHRISAPITKPRWLNQWWFAIVSWRRTRKGFDVIHSHESTWHGQVQTVHVLPIRYSLFQGRTGWGLAMRMLKVVSSPRLLAYMFLERLRFTVRSARFIVATSPALAAVVKDTYPHCTVSVVAPGVLIPFGQRNRQDARRNLGVPEHGALLAFVANDYQKKGLATLLEALALMPRDVILAVVGNPSYIEKFKQQATALGLSARVHFLGYLSDISTLFEAADALAHPTTEDTFAMVVLEAMAYGVPVVVSDAKHCGISGLLTNGVNAMILSSNSDAGELAATLTQILTEPVLYRQIADGARLFAAKRTWAAIAHQQELMYQQIAAAA